MNVTGLVGWFDRADQEEPTFDPPHEGPCPICGDVLTAETVRTISVMYADGTRSLFYRVHRACADPTREAALDGAVLDYASGLFN